MSKIIWISSYPKSGNTFVRIFLSSYLFTKNGNFEDFKIINNIGGFNNLKIFKRIKNFCKKKRFDKRTYFNKQVLDRGAKNNI